MLLRYSTSTISPQQASRLANTVAQAIRCVLKNPNQILSDVDLISTQELRDISHWNSRDLPAVYSNSITEIITAKSLSRPGAQAIYSSDRVLSYYDINMLSSRLAVYLRELGVGTNVMVPLCFEKSIWAVVATLAVLKAGAASVPLDASHPLPRLKQIIRQVNATVVITSTRHLKMLEGASERVITVSESLIMQLSNRNEVADAHVLPHHLAYVLFTSGSTGSPKGCIINHQALAAAANQGEALQISADSRVLQFASPSFGVSLIEIFCTLSAGGTICIPSEDERINDLTGAINRMMVNWALLTPSLINSIESSSVPRLETLVVAGEPSNKEILENWIQKVHLIHAYGLTEWVGICTVQHMTIPTANPRCIGKSPNANLWLVNPDNHNILAPIGALAELLIEGSCLAQGYLNDAQRTAASFVAMPSWLPHFQPGKARRLYKTGDLVRYNHDGTINFITRKDTQVKIRGQRIELGEVEYHVCRHFCGATKIIADMITPRNSETPFLTAFVFSGKKTSEQLNNQPDMNSILASPNETFKSNSATARAITREYLPDYMVPQVTLPLKYIPVTVTGKVDRHTLRRIAGALSYEDLISYSQIQSENVSPRSSIEHLLHQSFARVLNLKPESFGVNDSFFLLGGDSIKAMQLANRFRCDGLYLSVPDIFRDKTVANLSFHASITPAMTANNFPSPDVPRISLESILQLKTGAMGITQKDIETVYPCSPVQNGMLLSQARESQYYRMHFVWEITATGNCTRVDSHKLQDVWHQLIYRHPMLRTVFLHDSASAHHFIQVVLHEGVGKASVVQCDNDFAFNANESRQQTDLRSKASLPKVKIRETSSGRVLCALDISHVQVDATSLEILKRDLVLAYDNKLPLPTGKNYGEYSNYVASLPKRLVLDYWIDYLAGCHPCHFPPLKEHLTKFHQSAEARSAEMALKNVTELRAFCSAKGLTMSNILQVAWGLVLQVYTGSDTVCFGYLNSSRDVPIDGIEDVVGPVINMLICRIDFTKIATRLQLVRKTQSDFVQALPWQCFLLSDLFHAMSLSGSTMFNTCMTIPPEEPVSQTSDQNSIKIKEIVQSFQDEVSYSRGV
ncbi:hypothetical protein BJX63DRAFT_438242 [Aspergillus granulosus]|uniref:Carrier domain-containing protein n=1 Tax=Aspergillus granulosus TaxID=176169 RepID=A0ABR4GT40_9EURO